MKRALSLVIALAMIFTMIPFAALAVGTGTYADPEIIEENGKYTATFEEGGGEYYYLWTATAAGTLSVTADSENTSETYDIDVNGFYLIADHDSSADEEGDSVVYDTVIDVVAGDEVEICVFDEDASEIAFHVEFNTLAGTEENPLLLYSALESKVEIAAGKTVYYRNTGNVNGMVFTLTGSDVSVAYNGTTYVAADGKITFSCTQSNMNEPCTFAFTNTGSEDAVYTVVFAAPEGTWDNPAALSLGSNTATVAAGTNGYYYTYTADEEGILTITMAEDNANGWFYSIVNQVDYSSTADHLSTPAEGDPVFSDSMEMHAGDYVIVLVNTYEAGNTSAPAGSVNFTASFEACEIDTDEGGEGGEGEGGEGGEITEGIVASGEAVTATAAEPILVEYTPETDGILTVVISSTPGYKLTVHDADEGTVGLPKESSSGAEQTVTYELSAGVTYTVRMVGYANYDEANGSITYTISFAPSEITEEEEVYIISDTALALGENTLTLEAGAKTTLYVFTPTETGTYGFSGPVGSVVGYWGGGSWWLVDPQADSFYCEQTISGVGQSAYIGVSGEDLDGEFTLTVTKVADYSEVIYNEVKYQNKATLSSFQLPEDAVLGEYVDVSTPHTAVLGDDGYYHLDSADGDILLIDMNYKDIVLTAVLSSDRPIMYAYVQETDGTITKYDIIEAIQAYEAVTDSEGYYPLTEDLIFFYDVYANGTGTWSFHLEEGTYDADTAWMYCCRTVSGLDGGETEDPDDPIIPDVPTDGDGTSRENAILIQHGDVLNVTLTADNAVSGVWYMYVAENENPLVVKIDEAEVENYSILYLDAYINDSTTVDASDDGQKLTVSPAVGDVVYVCVNVPEGDAATATLSVVAEQPGASETTALSVYDGAFVTVPAGQTVYYVYQQYFGSDTYILDVTGNTGFAVTNAGNAVADSEGAVSATVAAEGTMPTQFYFAITNNTEEEQSYYIGITVPVGTMSNPDILNIGENSADVAGNGEAYFYNWTAMEEGTLTLTMNGTNWTVAVNNMSTGVYGDTISGTDGVMTYTVEVEAYDGIEVVVGTADNTAATVTFTAEFQGPQPVATIGDVAYFTVYDALNAAVSGDQVVMIADSDESGMNLLIDEGVTLVIGVYDLHAKSLTGLSGSSISMDRYSASKDYGRLYVNSAKHLIVSEYVVNNTGTTGPVPVWDTEEKCYIMGGASFKTSNYELNTENDTISFKFAPTLGGAVLADYFQDDSAMEDNGLRIVLRLTWTVGTDGAAQQDFVYSVNYTSLLCRNGGRLTFTLKGFSVMDIDLEELTITPMIVSDNGYMFCGPTITGA